MISPNGFDSTFKTIVLSINRLSSFFFNFSLIISYLFLTTKSNVQVFKFVFVIFIAVGGFKGMLNEKTFTQHDLAKD